MKKYIIATSFLVTAVMVVFYSCKKTYTKVADYQIIDSSVAHLKIVHASPLFSQVTGKQDTFNIYLNGARLLDSPSMTFGSVFPATTSASSGYLAVPPGNDSIRLTVPGGKTNPDSSTILTLNKTLLAGKYYTLMLTDSILSTKDSNRIFVQDSYPYPVTGTINLRFIHAIVNDTPGKTVDLFSYAKNAAIVSKIKPDSVTTFMTVGINPSVADTLYVRRTGTTQNLAKLLFSGTSQRTYTIYYAGNDTLSGKKAKTLLQYNH